MVGGLLVWGGSLLGSEPGSRELRRCAAPMPPDILAPKGGRLQATDPIWHTAAPIAAADAVVAVQYVAARLVHGRCMAVSEISDP